MNIRPFLRSPIGWLTILALGFVPSLSVLPSPPVTAATTICGWVQNPNAGPGNTGVLELTLTVCGTDQVLAFDTYYGTFDPSAEAQVSALMAQGAIPGYFRIYDPAFHTFPGDTTMLVGFSRMEAIAGCEACNPPTPTNPAPTAVPALCGLSTSAAIQSGMTGYTRPVIVPCGSSQPIAIGSLGQFGDERLYRFYNPQIVPMDAQESSLGAITSQLVAWDRVEEIPSCQTCGLSDPIPQRKDSLMLKSLDWEAPPQAFEPATLILTLQGEGATIDKAAFVVEITFGEDFPYHQMQYVFDSEDPSSAAHLSPPALQPGNFQMRITGLRFPMTYQGACTVAVSLKGAPDAISSLSRQLAIGSSPGAYRHCIGAIFTASTLVVKVPETQKAQVAITTKYLDSQERIQLCGDNPACLAYESAAFQEEFVTLAIEQGAKLTPPGAIALTFKESIEFGLDTVKCSQWFIEYHLQLLHRYNQKGTPINGFMTASPVYPLVQDANGQRTGFLPDGTTVQDIPDSYALEIGEKRVILLPETAWTSLRITGYAPGTMDLYVTLAQPGGDLTLTYHAVATAADTRMTLDAADSQYTLVVESGGRTESRLPNEIRLASSPGASPRVPGSPSPGPTRGHTPTSGMCPAFGLGLLPPAAIYLLNRRIRKAGS